MSNRAIPVDNPKKGTRYYDGYWIWEFNGYCWTNIGKEDNKK